MKGTPRTKEREYHHITVNGETVFYDGVPVFSATVACTNCCGVDEVCDLDESKTVSQDIFNKCMDEWLRSEERALVAYYQLTLSRSPSARRAHQSKLQNYLNQLNGAYSSPWRKNPYTGNYIQVWLIEV